MKLVLKKKLKQYAQQVKYIVLFGIFENCVHKYLVPLQYIK